MAGADFVFNRKEIQVWAYTRSYPPRIEVDCQYLSPNNPVKIGDVEKMLPYGVYLHKKYYPQRFHAVVKLQ
jgi:hypothetical protein